MMAPDMRGAAFFLLAGLILVPIAGIVGVIELVRGIVWLCHHVRFQ